jgi:hypothetical protein
MFPTLAKSLRTLTKGMRGRLPEFQRPVSPIAEAARVLLL